MPRFALLLASLLGGCLGGGSGGGACVPTDSRAPCCVVPDPFTCSPGAAPVEMDNGGQICHDAEGEIDGDHYSNRDDGSLWAFGRVERGPDGAAVVAIFNECAPGSPMVSFRCDQIADTCECWDTTGAPADCCSPTVDPRPPRVPCPD